MAERPSIQTVGQWLKSRWWQAAVGSAALIVAAAVAMSSLPGGPAKVTGNTPEDRVAAIEEIKTERPPGAAEALAGAVRDTNPQVREAAIAALGQFKKRPDLVQAALQDPDQNVRVTAAETVGIINDPQAPDVLAAVVFNESVDAATRKGALRGLARTGTPRATVQLVRAMDVPQPEVARTAMEVLTGTLGIRWWDSPPNPADRKEWARKKEVLQTLLARKRH